MSSIEHLRLLWHSARHTRSRQLLARMLLHARRRGMVWLASVGAAGRPAGLPRRGPEPQIADRPPQPLFRPREDLVEHEGDAAFLRFLNLRHPLTLPLDWHPDDWDHGTRLERLNLHYMEFLEALDDASAAATIEDWIRNVPPYRPGYWRDDWNSFALSIRCVVWMQQYSVRSDRWSADLRGALLRSLRHQLRFLSRNLELDIGGNHLIKNIKALLWAGRFFAGAEAEGWSRRGRDLLRREVGVQLLDDGVHFERSPAYHAQVLADLLECLQVVEAGDESRRLEAALSPMAQALADLTHPDGRISLFNDGGLHMTYQPGEILAVHEALTGNSAHPASRVHLPQAGYFGVRDSGNFFLADCGSIAPDFLPAHGHGDILAFEWDVAGRRFIVDAGVFEYHPGTWRAYARSTAAHNTVTVGDADQCEFWKAFRVGRRARIVECRCSFDGGALELQGAHDGFRRLPGAPLHRRRFRTDAARVEVTDQVEGGRGQAVRARLLCHPGCEVRPYDGGLCLERDGVGVRLLSGSPVRVDRAWWMPDFGLRRETCQIIIDYGSAPCEGSFVLES